MRQTTLSVTLEVKPESKDQLDALIDRLHDRHAPGASADDFGWFMAGVPSVHFLSMNVFPGADFDPLYVLEANFDGEPGVFWGQLEAAIGEDLRAMVRCCKKPLTRNGVLFDAVTADKSTAPVAPYFEAQTSQPTVFHHGNRGMTRDRILAERELFLKIRDEIASAHGPGPSPYRGSTPAKIHRDLRAALKPKFGWLGEKAPARVPFLTRVGDFARLIAFAIMVIVALALPGLILGYIMPANRYFILLGVVLLVFLVALYRMKDALPGTDTGGKFSLITAFFKPANLILVVIGGALYLVLAVAIAAIGPLLTHATIQQAWSYGLHLGALGGACVPVTVLGIIAWLRYLERRDSSQDKPPIDEEMVRQMAQREDWIPQNHMGSIVIIKPGILRAIIIRAGHHGLGLALRALANSGVRGYLGSMRTVHFAHWVFANNTSRLIFFSNFDQSWESYLDDFIEKAHVGLTLAWGCGIGFPPTRFLIQDGASHGRKFKVWARHSMTISRFWYSAYPDLTVDQVERNNRIANGLRKPALTEKEASVWINDL